MIRKAIEGVDRCVMYAGLVATFIMMLLTSADALGRYAFDHPIEGAYQITEDYLLVLAVYLVLGYSYREGAHVRVTFLVDRLKGSAGIAVGYLAQIFSILCGVALTVATWWQAADALRRGTRANGMFDYVLWPAYAAVCIGCVLMTLLMIIDLPRVKDGTSRLLIGESVGEEANEVI